nr:hypothetical protein [Tanacetum cinerariifolium]
MMILSCRLAIADDYRLGREIKRICEKLVVVVGEGDHFIEELDVLVGRRVLGKTVKFLKETQVKDGLQMLQLQILTGEVELRVREKNILIQKLRGSWISRSDGEMKRMHYVVQPPFFFFVFDDSSGRRSRFAECASLRERVGGWEWVDTMVLYCQWSAAEDREFMGRINVLFYEMLAAYGDKMDFIWELKVVPGVVAAFKTAEFLNETLWKDDKRLRKLQNMEMGPEERAYQKESVPEKMAEFMKEIQGKYIHNLMKLQILGREFELRAQEKNLFIRKLKGNMDF